MKKIDKANKTYSKSDSILEIIGNTSNENLIKNKVKFLLDEITQLDKNDPLYLALKDLFYDDEPSIFKNDDVSNIKFELKEHVIEELNRLNSRDIKRYLRYRYSYDIFPKVFEVRDYPPVLQIEPASICNYRCVFCFQTDNRLTEKKNGNMGVMNIDIYKRIIDEIEGKVEGVTLASRGEPLVNKMLPEMLKYSEGKFLALKINTNASLLNEKNIRAILDANIQTLVFSADAADKELYSKLRVNGNLDRVLKNIELFSNIKAKEYSSSKTITRVSGVKYAIDQNFNSIQEFWNKYVDQVSFVDYNPWENVYDSEINGVTKPCSDLWRRMFIWWDGKACPCDVDYLTTLMKLNVNDHSVKDIWNSQDYKELRKNHQENNRSRVTPCSRCVVI